MYHSHPFIYSPCPLHSGSPWLGTIPPTCTCNRWRDQKLDYLEAQILDLLRQIQALKVGHDCPCSRKINWTVNLKSSTNNDETGDSYGFYSKGTDK